MGSVIPLKKSANSAYLELKNLVGNKLTKVEDLIELKLKSKVYSDRTINILICNQVYVMMK